MTCEEEIKRLKAELSLRTLMYPHSGFTIPQKHRIRGQHIAFLDGFETAWRGHPKNNPYEFYTAQYQAFNTGFSEGSKEFCKAFVEAIR